MRSDSDAPEAMPIDVAQLVSEAAHLGAAEIGAYLLLVAAWWWRGTPLDYDDRDFAQTTRLFSVRKWRRMRPRLESMFDVTAKGWTPRPMQWMRHWRGSRRLLPRDSREMPADWRQIRQSVFERDDFTCRYCGARGGKLECDHVLPRSRGGRDDPDNLVTACKPCNRRKRTRTPEEMGWSLH